jgi:HEAT repeat protein
MAFIGLHPTSISRGGSSPQFLVRQKAEAELRRLGNQVTPSLKKALKTAPSPEVERRLQNLLKNNEDGLAHGDGLRGIRAVEVLEWLGTPPARALLQKLAADPTPGPLRAEARAAVARSKYGAGQN